MNTTTSTSSFIFIDPAEEPAIEERHGEQDEPLSSTHKIAILIAVTLPVLGLAAAIVLLWGRGIGALEITLLAVMYSLTILGVTVGFHRQFTHKSFDTVPAVRMLLAIFGSMSAEGSVITWCAVHRMHHQHSDHEGDPHSPHLHGGGFRGFLKGVWHSHMGWLFQAHPKGLNRYVPDLLADKALLRVDRLFPLWVLIGFVIPTAIGGLVTGTWMGALLGFLWGGLVRVFLMHHVTWSVNSICHIWGSKDFRSHDESRNNWLFGVIGFGEGWHNNHHAFPTSARHGLKWWQIDFSYVVIRVLNLLGLAWNIRIPAKHRMELKAAK